jgi:hypothetical protein
MTTDRRTKKRRKECYEVAMRRARRARRTELNPVIIWLLFVWAFLSAPFGLRVLPVRVPGPMNGQASQDDWPVMEYERGHPGPFRRRSSPDGSRYRSRPSMQRLMVDLRRPAARADAAAALALRISDPAVRAWAAERIDKREINRLAIWVRPGRSEEAVLAAWQEETEAALAEKTVCRNATDTAPDSADMLRVARLLEALAGTETNTADGPKRPGRD